jgi:hypothetical protein
MSDTLDINVDQHGDFDFYPVANIHGSLPMGGYVENTPIYAAGSTIILDNAEHKDQNVFKTELDIGGRVGFYLDDVVNESEASKIIAITEAMGYQAAAPGIMTPPGMRLNKSVHWVGNDQMFEQLFDRFKHLLPQQLDGRPLYKKLSHRLNMYKYDQDDVFNPHTDGDWPGFGLNHRQDQMEEWIGPRSKLTMLMYLNGHDDGVEGGYTRLFRPDHSFVSVAPKAGRALFFRHGQGPDSVIHEGTRVTGNISKYVARINVLYA